MYDAWNDDCLPTKKETWAAVAVLFVGAAAAACGVVYAAYLLLDALV